MDLHGTSPPGGPGVKFEMMTQLHPLLSCCRQEEADLRYNQTSVLMHPHAVRKEKSVMYTSKDNMDENIIPSMGFLDLTEMPPLNQRHESKVHDLQ